MTQTKSEMENITKVYALYGSAVYHAALLEKGIAKILSGNNSLNLEKISKQRYEYFFDDNLNNSFDRLITILSSKLLLDSTLEIKLKEALRTRNWLAHQYWWDRSSELESDQGRERMEKELNEIIDLFCELENVFLSQYK